jgi:hypothetical protein
MSVTLVTFSVDDTSPCVSYSPFGDTFSTPNLIAGWNPYFDPSGYAKSQGEVGNGTSLHITSLDGASLGLQWSGALFSPRRTHPYLTRIFYSSIRRHGHYANGQRDASNLFDNPRRSASLRHKRIRRGERPGGYPWPQGHAAHHPPHSPNSRVPKPAHLVHAGIRPGHSIFLSASSC